MGTKCGDNNELKFDCLNVCNGTHRNNPCGICYDSTSKDFLSHGKDCQGVCSGTATMDRCGKCLKPSSKEWNECVGCDNVPNSNMMLNPCRMCILSTRSDFKTYGTDCSGECDGKHEIDDCDKCLLRTDAEWNSCGSDKSNVDSNGTSNDTMLIVIIAVAAFVLICCAFIVILYLYNKHKEMKRAFDEIKQSYVPMDDVGQSKNTNIKTTKKKITKLSIPDQEQSD